MRRLEKSVEAEFTEYAEGQGCLCIKMKAESRRGWPDRLVLGPRGLILFIEFKRPGVVFGKRKGEKLQAYIHSILRRLGFDVIVTDSVEEAKAALSERLHNRRRKAAP